jgi:hypothetical protein
MRARWSAGVFPAAPTLYGLRARFTLTQGEDVVRVVDLPAAGWTRTGRGFRFDAPGCDGRIVRARLVTRRRVSRFTLALPGCIAPLAGPGVSRIAIFVTSGDVRWCAEITEVAAGRRRLTGRARVPLPACPCESLPADTFAAIERRLFARHGCALQGCHGAAAPQADLRLAPGVAYGSLVGVPSQMDPARLRVAPGDPEGSFLWRKVAARTIGLTDVAGLGMPIGDPPFDAVELEALRLWIAAGAPETGLVPAAHVLLDCASTDPQSVPSTR